LGYIGGTIYLRKKSMLSDVLSQHFYAHDSIISMVSNDGLIIFSHDPARVGKKMTLCPALQKQLATTESGRFSSEADGQQFLTGYASLHRTDWNIFIAGSSETVRQILMSTVKNALWLLSGIIILVVAVMTVLTVLAGRIAFPLEKLAGMVRDGGSEASPTSLASV